MRVLRLQYLNNLYDVRVVKLSKKSDLSQNSLAVDFILEDVLHALDRNLASGGLVYGSTHAPVAPDADHFFNFIAEGRDLCPVLKLLSLSRCLLREATVLLGLFVFSLGNARLRALGLPFNLLLHN